MSKTKIVEKIVRFELFLILSLVDYVKVTNSKTFQNKIFPELNYKKQLKLPSTTDVLCWRIFT